MTDDAPPGGHPRRLARRAAITLAGLLVLALGWWAGRVTLPPRVEPSTPADEVVTATVVEATVGRSVDYVATAERPLSVIAVNHLAGVVTEVTDRETAAVGDVVYAVAGQPVRAAEAGEPFFRDLTLGARGDDVAALQGLLVDAGLLSGESDGRFGQRTALAVRAWQKRTGVPVTGSVALGELVAVPSLPARVVVDDELSVGRLAVPGTGEISSASATVEVTLVLAPAQASAIPVDAAITVRHGETSWPARIGEVTTNEEGNSVLHLVSGTGGPVCGDDCGAVPTGSTRMTASVQLVPQVSGPSVPLAAVRTDPTGQAFLTAPDGTAVPVEVRGSGNGIAVVDGVGVGTPVVVLGPSDG